MALLLLKRMYFVMVMLTDQLLLQELMERQDIFILLMVGQPLKHLALLVVFLLEL